MSGRRPAAVRCVGDVQAFAREYWGRAPMVRRGSEPFDDLLDVVTVEELLVNLGRRPTFRVVKSGATIAPGEYLRRTRVGGVDLDDVADVDRVLDLVAGGATVVLQGLQRTSPALRVFCRELEDAASHAVQANAYLSPPSAAGLAAHADRHDVIVLQVAGTKQWIVEGLGDVTLTAGDSMYLPAGTRHEAATTEAFSLHITLGLTVTTRRDVLRRVLDGLDGDLDRPLPFGYANEGLDALTEEFGTVLNTAAERFAHSSAVTAAGDELQRVRRRVRNRARPGRLAAVVDPSALSDDQRLRRRAWSTVSTSTEPDGTLVVQLDDRRLRMPGAAADSMAVVETHHEFAVGDLAGLDRSSRVVVARRLVREGLLELIETHPTATMSPR